MIENKKFHGKGLRGSDISNRPSTFEGRFGRIFKSSPGAIFDEDALLLLADKMVSKAEDSPTPEEEIDSEENPNIPAGYTYLGQFIDHDLTFDPVSFLQGRNDPDGLTDFRTPRFDLDSVYGRGPSDNPFLYDGDGVKLLLGRPLTGSDWDANTRDLQRNSPHSGEQRAIIGDPRNDENVIVSQLQSNFIRFHNRMVDVLTPAAGPAPSFDEANRFVRWHYQWVVLNDFLPRIIGEETIKAILPDYKRQTPLSSARVQKTFYEPQGKGYIPIEFTAAVYRFGHSMIRPIYRLNTNIPRFEIFSMNPATSLLGFRAFPDNWAIDWRLYFPIEVRPLLGPTRVQPSYKIDSSLVNPLQNLPDPVAQTMKSLAARNLLRGASMSLPSGQVAARKMNIPVLPEEKLKVGKANEDIPTNPEIRAISPEFEGNAPLWYYILAEAQQDPNNTRLRGVGARIIGEVFIRLLIEDPSSYLCLQPSWTPFHSFTRPGSLSDAEFGMAELLMQSKQG